jgi:hypothetical protein
MMINQFPQHILQRHSRSGGEHNNFHAQEHYAQPAPVSEAQAQQQTDDDVDHYQRAENCRLEELKNQNEAEKGDSTEVETAQRWLEKIQACEHQAKVSFDHAERALQEIGIHLNNKRQEYVSREAHHDRLINIARNSRGMVKASFLVRNHEGLKNTELQGRGEEIRAIEADCERHVQAFRDWLGKHQSAVNFRTNAEQRLAHARASEHRANEQKAALAALIPPKLSQAMMAVRGLGRDPKIDAITDSIRLRGTSPQTVLPSPQSSVDQVPERRERPAVPPRPAKIEQISFAAKQVMDLHKELEQAYKTGADKQQIYQRYTAISETNRAQATAAECASNPFCASGALAQVESGNSIAKTLGRISLLSSLPNEDRSEFCRFVFNQNQETAGAIYDAMPGYVKAALSAQEAAQAVGLGSVVGNRPPATLGAKARAQPYKPNKGAVNNMGEFFKQPGFGSEMAEKSRRTKQAYQGQTVYKTMDNIGSNIKEGDIFYLDAKHRNHLEVFDENRRIKAVVNLDGTLNDDKTKKARAEGRRLDK